MEEWIKGATEKASTLMNSVENTPVVSEPTEQETSIPEVNSQEAGQVEDVNANQRQPEPHIDDTQLNEEQVAVEETTVPVVKEETNDNEFEPDYIKSLKQKKWDELEPSEQRDLNDYTKKEYNRYNTQTSQSNSAIKKQLEEQQKQFNSQQQEFMRWREEQIRTVQQQQGQETHGEESETDMLNRTLGLKLDEFSTENEMIMARKQLEHERQLAETHKYNDQQTRQQAIDRRTATWEKLKAEQSLPDTQEFHEGIMSRVYTMRQYNPNYDVADAVADEKRSLGIDTGDNFINFVKKNPFYEQVKAHIVSELRKSQAGSPPVVNPSGTTGIGSSPKKKYTPTGSLDQAMKNAIASIGRR